MQGGVGSSVAAWVEAVTGGFTAGCGNGGGGAQVGEGGFVVDASGVASGGDGELCGDGGAGAVDG